MPPLPTRLHLQAQPNRNDLRSCATCAAACPPRSGSKATTRCIRARPGIRSPAWPVGKSAKFYDSDLNPPYMGELGSNDEFLWVVYRQAAVLHMLRMRNFLICILYVVVAGVGLSVARAEDVSSSGSNTVSARMEQAREDAKKMSLPANRHTEAGRQAAEQTAKTFHSPDFQERLQCEQQRLEQEVSEKHTAPWKQNPVGEQPGNLAATDMVYLFLSSSVPEAMVNRYLYRNHCPGKGYQRIVPVLCGLLKGREDIKASTDYFSRVTAGRSGLSGQERNDVPALRRFPSRSTRHCSSDTASPRCLPWSMTTARIPGRSRAMPDWHISWRRINREASEQSLANLISTDCEVQH